VLCKYLLKTVNALKRKEHKIMKFGFVWGFWV